MRKYLAAIVLTILSGWEINLAMATGTTNTAEERKNFAIKVFKDYPGKIAPAMQEKILAQQVVLGMSPYEAYLAGGAFAFRVIADPSKWKANADPYNVIWAQSTNPDDSQIWMTFKNDTQYPGEGLALFRVQFKNGVAISIEKLKSREP